MADRFFGMPTRRKELGNTMLRPAPARILTTFDAGVLVPIWSKEMLPGETIEIDPAFIVRSQTPIRPVMDDAYLDLYAYYVPNRLVLDTWEQVMGENKSGYWVDTTDHSVPYLQSAASVGFLKGSVADYFGLPTGVANLRVNALRPRMYALIWNEDFRDQNVMSPAACPTNDTGVTSPSSLGDPILEAYKGGALLPVCRLPDYFSTSTPGPLKATNVVSVGLPDVPVGADTLMSSPTSLFWSIQDPVTGVHEGLTGVYSLAAGKPGSGSGPSGRTFIEGASTDEEAQIFANLKAMTSTVGISINDFRFAFQLQKLLERDLFGTRYTEVLQAYFGVKAADSRLQRPEMFGWRRYRLNQQQVAQTSATGSTGTPQGNMAAYSLTVGAGGKWRTVSPEHGFVLVLGCIRVKHTYSEGIARDWTRFARYDYAWPEFIGLGNQPVYKNEISAKGPIDPDDQDKAVWGYQEYAADYRYNRRFTTGEMRPGITGTLDSWHYGDFYGIYRPSLGSTWMADNSKMLIDRTLAVTSATANQFFGCFDLATEITTWLPMYSIPGYVDHF